MDETGGVSRRDFLKAAAGGAGLGVAALAPYGLSGKPIAGPAADPATPADDAPVARGETPLALTVNGKPREILVEPRTTLLDALRLKLDLTGAKTVCDRGACGACTVLLDGKPVVSCTVLALDAAGRAVLTVEGLARSADGDMVDLHPVQRAFIEHDALQCGFCTPGFVMATKALLDAKPAATDDDIRHGLSGNICRCGAYMHIFEAARAARDTMAGKEGARWRS